MQLPHLSLAGASAIGLIFIGCASFEPGLRLQDMHRPRQPTAKATQEGLEVSVEEFVTSAKSQMMFDTDLSSNGVFAILVRVENTGTEKYTLRRGDIKAFVDGQPLTPLSARQAANQAATSEYAGKALGWTVAAGPFAILLWPVTIGASCRAAALRAPSLAHGQEPRLHAHERNRACDSPAQQRMG